MDGCTILLSQTSVCVLNVSSSSSSSVVVVFSSSCMDYVCIVVIEHVIDECYDQ